MEEWKEYRLGDIIAIKSGFAYKGDMIGYGENFLLGMGCVSFKERFLMSGARAYAGDCADRYCAYSGDIVLATRQQSDNLPILGMPAIIPNELREKRIIIGANLYRVDNESDFSNEYIYWLLKTPLYVNHIRSCQSGTTVRMITKANIEDFRFKAPGRKERDRISHFLKSLDDKIEVNRRINDNFYLACLEVILIWLLTSLENDNLEKQAMALFDMMFPAVASGEDVIGNVIIPKRGKGLLSKDAVEGNVPVVAGGLEPATYHNESNTVAPVVTISASGANAGFVNLWQIPVWSSDSSFIDASMTENVYFWYVMLKKRQKEIFDAQTGSAQPHIYPKHIAEMPMGNFEHSDVEKFTEIVTPMFEIRGRNLKESERLSSIRDSLLPKLMSGELKLNEVNV